MGVFLFALTDKPSPPYFRVIYIASLKYVQVCSMKCQEVLNMQKKKYFADFLKMRQILERGQVTEVVIFKCFTLAL